MYFSMKECLLIPICVLLGYKCYSPSTKLLKIEELIDGRIEHGHLCIHLHSIQGERTGSEV